MKRTTVIRAAVAVVAGAALTAVTLPAAAQQQPDVAAAPPDKSIAAADALVANDAAAAVLFKGAGDTMVRQAVQPGPNGLRYVSYERTYRGLPVVGGDAVVVTDTAGTVRATAVAQRMRIAVGTTPKITAAAAAATARPLLRKVDKAETRLVVLAWGTPRLAYETVLSGFTAERKPADLHVFVDARTGRVTESYDTILEGTGNGFYYGQVDINTSGSGSSFSMVDPTRPGLQCGGQNGAAFTGTDDAWGNGQGTNLETACVDTLFGAQREWDMLGEWLGRNGINGNGRGFPARVGLNQVNAFWNGSFTNFGRSQDNQRQATPIDVVAHEYGHAIFQTTPGGSGGGNETGGLNEGAADIFGALTEHFANSPNDPPDYEVGEEVNLVGRGPIRFMYEPSRISGHPNCFSNAIPGTEVHAGAGPINHWFYLTAEGSNPGGGKPNSPTCNNSTVTGIGIRKAGQIFYNAMLMKTSGWRYVQVRVAALTAARNLFPGSCTEFNTVRAAFNAISVPAQPNEPTCNVGGNDFSVSVSPASASVAPGSSATATVSTAVTSGSAQSVALSASGLPAGATATFNPASVTAGGSSTLTIATSASTPTGTFTVTVTGTGASGARTATFAVTVGGGGGGCTATNGTDVAIPDAGAAVTSTINITGCNRNASATSTVAVTIPHTYRGDLVIDLVAPDGTAYRLKNSNSGDSADNVNTTFTANLSSEAGNGAWRLRVQDVLAVDTGRIDTWTLTL